RRPRVVRLQPARPAQVHRARRLDDRARDEALPRSGGTVARGAARRPVVEASIGRARVLVRATGCSQRHADEVLRSVGVTELWHPSEHEALAGEEWSDEAAEQAIAAIVADAEAAFDGKRWPFHPADEPDDSPNDIYLGVAGMAWALHELGSSGWADAVLGAFERYPREPDGAPEYSWAPSYLGGACGIALVGDRRTS